ncbi:MAG TPA: Na+/H+ antiporter subunit C [Thauera sp.]|uniref:Na+/H+ antiporter subunit C n=1 Tax=Thauera sp. TaxID=1905334 RepID=UPI002D0B288F|nr:Na+/H+ antiporter subunit C [Thauera sp.]HRP22958.1 Na+/H+ antiporter subunit C [Thauera sp.]HRP65758.1 Na+/H+ antiporter subunit C [Thauera sp.]
MEFLIATAIGAMTAAGVYLVLRARTFPVVIGLTLLTYATNLFLFATGRLVVNRPPVISADALAYTDPLPQALVLTAIVISFGMTAVIVVMALRAYLETGNDHVDLPGDASPEARDDDWKLLGRKQGDAVRPAAAVEESA